MYTEGTKHVMEDSIDIQVIADSQYTLEFLKTSGWTGQSLQYLNGIILKGMVVSGCWLPAIENQAPL